MKPSSTAAVDKKVMTGQETFDMAKWKPEKGDKGRVLLAPQSGEPVHLRADTEEEANLWVTCTRNWRRNSKGSRRIMRLEAARILPGYVYLCIHPCTLYMFMHAFKVVCLYVMCTIVMCECECIGGFVLCTRTR